MSMEGFSKRGMELGNDPEGLHHTANNIKNGTINSDYLNSVKRLALTKIKNDLLFEGQLGATIRRLSSLGINVSKETILRDIQTEINKQKLAIGFNDVYESGLEPFEDKGYGR